MTVPQLKDALAACHTELETFASSGSEFRAFGVAVQGGFLDLSSYTLVVTQLAELERACFESLGALRDADPDHASSVRWLGERSRGHGLAYERLSRLVPSPWPDLLSPISSPSSSSVVELARALRTCDPPDAPTFMTLMKGDVYPCVVTIYHVVADTVAHFASGRNLREYALMQGRSISSLL